MSLLKYAKKSSQGEPLYEYFPKKIIGILSFWIYSIVSGHLLQVALSIMQTDVSLQSGLSLSKALQSSCNKSLFELESVLTWLMAKNTDPSVSTATIKVTRGLTAVVPTVFEVQRYLQHLRRKSFSLIQDSSMQMNRLPWLSRSRIFIPHFDLKTICLGQLAWTAILSSFR